MSGNDRSKVQLNRCSTILIGLRHIGQPLSIDATVAAEACMTTWHECDVGALCDEAHHAHLRIVCANSSCWGCGWCSVDGLSDGVVGVSRVVVVTGVGSKLESVRVCPETVADGVQKLEACVCAGVQTIDAGLDPHIILHVALLLGTTDAHSIADPRQVCHVVSGNVLQLFQEREQVRVRDSYSATKTNTMKTLSIQQFWKHSTACHYCYSFPAKQTRIISPVYAIITIRCQHFVIWLTTFKFSK